MKTLWEIMSWVTDKDRFITLNDYFNFAETYLEFIETELQAEIVSKKEMNYAFFQYKRDGEYNFTRPINNDLFYRFDKYQRYKGDFLTYLQNIRYIKNEEDCRKVLNNFVYTTQQTIGCALDSLPSSKTNSSRKLNGDLFERLIRLIIAETGISVDSGIMSVPIPHSEEKMNFQNDLQIKNENDEIVAIGSVKTSSKDRLDKIFLDKLMFEKLTETNIPHFAIFLHDVQRSGKEPNFKISQTLKTGHFKAYTIALNPLDGVYYCDLRPIMKTDSFFQKHIKSLDCLLCEDLLVYMK